MADEKDFLHEIFLKDLNEDSFVVNCPDCSIPMTKLKCPCCNHWYHRCLQCGCVEALNKR